MQFFFLGIAAVAVLVLLAEPGDAQTFTLTASTTTPAEGQDVVLTVTCTTTQVQTCPATTVTLAYSAPTNAGADGTDYTEVTQVIVPAGSIVPGDDMTGTATVPTISDGQFEGQENFIVEIASCAPACTEGSPNSQTIRIQDTLNTVAGSCGGTVPDWTGTDNVGTSNNAYATVATAGGDFCKEFDNVAAGFVGPTASEGIDYEVTQAILKVELQVSDYFNDEFLVTVETAGEVVVDSLYLTGAATDTVRSVNLLSYRSGWTVADVDGLKVTIESAATDGSPDGTWKVDRLWVDLSLNRAPLAVAKAGTWTEETAGGSTIAGEHGDPDGDALTYFLISGTGPVTGVLGPINPTTGAFTFTPGANQDGPDSFKFLVRDGNGLYDQETFAITITGINDAPVTTVPGAQTINEDTSRVFSTANGNSISVADVDAIGDIRVQLTQTGTPTVVGTFTLGTLVGLDFGQDDPVGDDGEGDAAMTFRGTVAEVNAALQGLTFTPAAQDNGATTLQVLVNDLGQSAYGAPSSPLEDTSAITVAITVTAVNDEPTLDPIHDPAAINEDDPVQEVVLSGIAAAQPSAMDETTPSQDLTVTAVSSDPAIVPNPTVTYTSPATGGRISYTPAAHKNGEVTITVTVADNGPAGGDNSVSQSFKVKITPVGDGPVIPTDIPNQNVNEETATGALAFTITDNDPEDLATMALTGTSSNQGIVLNDDITFGGSGGSRTVTVMPRSNGQAGTATITVRVQDTSGQWDEEVFTLTVTAVNDAPVLTVPGSQEAIEDKTLDLAGISVADPDAGELGVRVTLTATNGLLTLPSTTGLSFACTGTPACAGDGSNDAGMTFQGSVPNVNAGLAALQFIPAPGYIGSAQVSVSVNDQGRTGTGGTLTDSEVVPIEVTPDNDAPVLADLDHVLLGINEDAVDNAGQTIASFLDPDGGDSITDVDAGALEGIAVTGTAGEGTWQYSLDGTTWAGVGDVTGDAALLLRSADLVRYVPDGLNWEIAPFAFRAWDQTSGTAGETADTTSNGGTTAFSEAWGMAVILVTPVNDAPVLGASLDHVLSTINEDAVGNAGQTIASFLDPDGGDSITDVDAGALEGIAVTGTAGEGTWQYSLDGTTWAGVGDVTGDAALLLRSADLVRYVPDGLNGETAAFTFRAWDRSTGSEGTTADTTPNGGTTAFSTATDTTVLLVTDLNDAPVLDGSLDHVLSTINEDAVGNAGQTVASFLKPASITDVDTDALEGIAVTATAVTGGGVWQYSTDGGATWSDVGAVAPGNALLLGSGDLVRFNPDGLAGATGELTFRAWDQSTGTAGGAADTTSNGGTTAFSTTTDKAAITVTNLNEPPVAGDIGDQTAPRGALFSLGLTATDQDNPTGPFAFSKTTGPTWLSVAGATLSGTPGNAHVGTFGVTVRVTDPVGAWDEESFTVTVPNAAPVLAPIGGQSVAEDSAFSLVLSSSDADAGDTATYQFALGPRPSWLTLANGVLGGTPDQIDVGSAQVTIRVTDANGAFDEKAFDVTVTNVNDAPTISPVADQSTTSGTTLEGIPFTVNDVDSPADGVTVSVASSNPTLLPTIVVNGAYPSYTVTITPASDQFGFADVAITASDGAASSTETFLVTVGRVGAPPAGAGGAPGGSAGGSGGGAGGSTATDSDSDGKPNATDNCPSVANADQANGDGDALGNACDSDLKDGPTGDSDGDVKTNAADNCPGVANADQADGDGDKLGDACDGDLESGPTGDADADGTPNALDNCPSAANADQANADGDALGNACDADFVLASKPTVATVYDVPGGGDEVGSGGMPVWAWIMAGTLGLVVVGAGVVVVVLLRRH